MQQLHNRTALPAALHWGSTGQPLAGLSVEAYSLHCSTKHLWQVVHAWVERFVEYMPHAEDVALVGGYLVHCIETDELVLGSGWLYKQDLKVKELKIQQEAVAQYLDTVDEVLFGRSKHEVRLQLPPPSDSA
ncbi:hypothetical protein BC826DRAFT_1114231 [Russula brevipes]|nr:hypothetical protein BC826DRAFT_1114231 [Russula brevipes]